jgi:hypothetical protein
VPDLDVRSAVRVLVIVAVASMLGAALVGCPSPKMPSGPPPEYEDPPPPSWLKDAATPADPPPVLASDAGIVGS